MMRAYFESDYEIREVLRALFNCNYFKSEKARFARMKGPVELIVGAVRMAGCAGVGARHDQQPFGGSLAL